MDYSLLYNNNMNYGSLFGAYNPYYNMFGNYGMNSPFYDYKSMYNSWPYYQNGMLNDGMNNGYSNGMMNSMNTNGMMNSMSTNGMMSSMNTNGMMNSMNTNGMMNSMNTNGLTSNNNMFGTTMTSPELALNTRHINFGSAGYRSSSPLNKYQSLLKMKGTTTINSDNCLLSMGCISNQWGQTKKKS
uniref:Uncharacterized protein n=2 Tax=Strongyloides stercoralis TaxID=6248 RepID=A0AAF5D8F9_STRER